MVEFHLLRIELPKWFEKEVTVDQAMADKILKARDLITTQLEHPLGKRFWALMKKVIAPFRIMEVMVKEKGDDFANLLKNKEEFKRTVGETIEKRYKVEGERLYRRGFRALVYIFLTKIIVGILLELPYDLLVLKGLHIMPLAINIIFPPILLFGILISLRRPTKANTTICEQAVMEVYYTEEEPQVFKGRKKIILRKRSGIKFIIYSLTYALLFVLTFGIIIEVLRKIGFSAVSVLLFLFFLSIVSFFGVNLRQSAKELIIVSGKEKLITTLFDILTLPIVTAGRWVSSNVNRINIFLFILDVIIEAPFQFIIESAESWFDYLREKKEEI
ncbi:MAG: hypothetical protein V1821_02515 [bacterium]